jgi:hypothetical protein
VQQDAAFWEDVIDENKLEIGNDGEATQHWTREVHEFESVFNLTLVNRPITNWSIWAYNHTTGFNHEVIDWEVEVDIQEEAGHEMVVGWNLAAMAEEDAKDAQKLWMELAKERAHLDTECTADELELEAAWFQDAIGVVLDVTARRSGSAPNQRGGGTPTSGKEGRCSDGTNGGDGIRKRPPRRRQNSRSLFDSPRGTCGSSTCKS